MPIALTSTRFRWKPRRKYVLYYMQRAGINGSVVRNTQLEVNGSMAMINLQLEKAPYFATLHGLSCGGGIANACYPLLDVTPK